MPKPQIFFICQTCGYQTSKWSGKCWQCGSWNSFLEQKSPIAKQINPQEIQQIATESLRRKRLNFQEITDALSGGLLPGQVILLAGEPGIGKSTLILQIAGKSNFSKVLYVSGEESSEQIKSRSDRLGLTKENLFILATNSLRNISESFSKENYDLLVIDSVQTISGEDFDGAQGSVLQVRSCASQLIQLVKNTQAILFLVGHVTKEGNIAGPKTLEHLVDTVIYFEGQRFQNIRLLRISKNRFGAVDQGVFLKMGKAGLTEIENPSSFFLSQITNASGSAITALYENSQAYLSEIQALCIATNFGYPKRTTSGLNLNRLLLIIAVLQKHLELHLQNQDVYVNLTGGLRVGDHGIDLAIALAIYSSLRNLKIKEKTAIFGEIGLTGEVRSVLGLEEREKEAKKRGFINVIGPNEVKTLKEAVEKAF